MIWRLCNFLFGWDYVAWSNCADEGVAKVYWDGETRPYYWRYRITSVVDRIFKADQVIWLTCAPSKYLK